MDRNDKEKRMNQNNDLDSKKKIDTHIECIGLIQFALVKKK